MLDCYLSLAKLRRFKSVSDADGNVYVLFENSGICDIDYPIEDKTAFEAVENHCHLIDDLSSNDFSRIKDAAMLLGKMLYWSLGSAYPEKRFIVFVTADLGIHLLFVSISFGMENPSIILLTDGIPAKPWLFRWMNRGSMIIHNRLIVIHKFFIFRV